MTYAVRNKIIVLSRAPFLYLFFCAFSAADVKNEEFPLLRILQKKITFALIFI